VKNTDLAYIGAGVAAIGVLYALGKAGFVSLGDALASAQRTVGNAAKSIADTLNPVSPTNAAASGTSWALSQITGRDVTAGTLAADYLQPGAEKQINAPGFWTNPGRAGLLSNLTPMQDGEFGAVPYDVTGFVGNYPADPSQPAIFYRSMKRTATK
jgi:hypothetical protein